MQKFLADAPIEPNALGNVMHICAHFLTQIGDLVDERDLRGQKCVGRILDEF